jgi:hypothetical protein
MILTKINSKGCFSMPVPIAFPLRRRLPRSRHSSGQSRDHHGISIREERLCNRLYRLIKLQARILCMHPDDEETEAMLLDFIEVYIDRMYRRAHVLPRPVRRHITIANHVPEFCGEDYRFQSRSDVTRLFVSLHWPQRIGPFDNGQYLDGQISFLYFIRRVTSTCRVCDLIREFGRDKSLWSRVFKWGVRFLESEFEATLDEYHNEHVIRFPQYAEAIRVEVNKHLLAHGAPPGMLYRSLDIVGFIDNKCISTCRPGSGPAHGGPGAPRRDPGGLLQRSVFNGWKHIHGFKTETITAPNGLTMKAFNGVSLRHNDLFVLSLSDSNQKLADLQMTGGVPNARQFKIYGDSIYVPMSNLVSRHHAHAGHPQKADLDRDDKAMSSVRETVEWEYAEGDALFPLSVYKNKIKLMNFPFRETFFARMWLRNCYVCCYGDKISKRFDLQPPTLEDICSW